MEGFLEMHYYMSRSAAIAAARKACKVALNSSIYQAFEGPDFEIHPQTDFEAMGTIKRNGHLDLGDRWSFRLRGPAKENS